MALSTTVSLQIIPEEVVTFADTTTTSKIVDSLIDKIIALQLIIPTTQEVARYYSASKAITDAGAALTTLTGIAASGVALVYINNPKYDCTFYYTGNTTGTVINPGGCMLLTMPLDNGSISSANYKIKSGNPTDTIELFVVLFGAK